MKKKNKRVGLPSTPLLAASLIACADDSRLSSPSVPAPSVPPKPKEPEKPAEPEKPKPPKPMMPDPPVTPKPDPPKPDPPKPMMPDPPPVTPPVTPPVMPKPDQGAPDPVTVTRDRPPLADTTPSKRDAFVFSPDDIPDSEEPTGIAHNLISGHAWTMPHEGPLTLTWKLDLTVTDNLLDTPEKVATAKALLAQAFAAFEAEINVKFVETDSDGGGSSSYPSYDDRTKNDTIIYATKGTADISDDVAIMVLLDFTEELTMAMFEVV